MGQEPLLYSFNNHSPVIHETCFVAPTAVLVGQVVVGEASSIWYNCVARGDINKIIIGANTNIQDGCLLHVTNNSALIIEDRVTVGHGAILHGCHVEPDCLIAMGAIVLDGAVVGNGSIVAAGAVVSPGTRIAPGSLVKGIPARIVRSLDQDDRQKIERGWRNYVGYAAAYRDME